MQKSRDTQHFDQLSRQRVDFTSLANGGQRARLTVTLPGGRLCFRGRFTPSDVYQYEQQIAGVEIGLIQEVGGVGAFDFGSLTKGGIAASPLGKAGKAVGRWRKNRHVQGDADGRERPGVDRAGARTARAGGARCVGRHRCCRQADVSEERRRFRRNAHVCSAGAECGQRRAEAQPAAVSELASDRHRQSEFCRCRSVAG